MDPSQLHVIAVVSNPVRYQSRYELYRQFARHMAQSGANFYTVELAFGERPWEVTTAGNPKHLQLRTSTEIWHKENMVNLGLTHLLPSDWRYMAWVDADIHFHREDWIEETLQQLQHHQVVQMWQQAVDLGPTGQTLQVHQSFASMYLSGASMKQGGAYTHWHPGYAWAARREAIEAVGGLMEFPILGAADHHMAWALLDKGVEMTPKTVTPAYRDHIQAWQDAAVYAIKKDIGFVSGTILHYWHGKKRDRRYVDRWQILVKHRYDPNKDLVRDIRGVLKLTQAGLRMRDDIRAYFRARGEDSIDLD